MIENESEMPPGEHVNCQHDPTWDGDGSRTSMCSLALERPERPRYRVGHHQPQNIYDGDVYIGVMFSAPHAAQVVAALNEQERRAAAEKWAT